MTNGRVEIAGHLAAGFLSPAEETCQLVERVIYDPERVKWRQERRARFERLLSKDACGVREVSCDGSS